MPKFSTKPVEIEAIQWRGDNESEIWAWMSGDDVHGCSNFVTTMYGRGQLYVAANDAWLNLKIDEWIIRDGHGFYPCKPDVFSAKYEYVGAH
jgi:hypothetical protein